MNAQDSELERVTVFLLKRSSEQGNGFLSEEASKCLQCMIDSCSEARSLIALLAHTGHRSPATRGRVALFLALFVQQVGRRVFQLRDYDRLLQALGTMASEGSADIRNSVRHATVTLARLSAEAGDSGEFESALKRSLTPPQYKSLQRILERGLDQDLGAPLCAVPPQLQTIMHAPSVSGIASAPNRRHLGPTMKPGHSQYGVSRCDDQSGPGDSIPNSELV